MEIVIQTWVFFYLLLGIAVAAEFRIPTALIPAAEGYRHPVFSPESGVTSSAPPPATDPDPDPLQQTPETLVVFQVSPSVNNVKSGVKNLQVHVMNHVFDNSYGKPFVGSYIPPDFDFGRVILNLKVQSKGRQFDRLGIVYLNDTEIWRTSTAEPVKDGIVWTYDKDVTHFLSLWRQPQKLIFDLGNLIDQTYTASFNASLTLTFTSATSISPPADLIIPISKRLGSTQNKSSAFVYPDDGPAANTFTIPQNAKKAIFSIAACGQADEEFWWSNVPQSSINIFNTTASLTGYSPWREVQLFLDGKLTGVVWPFPIIFTGGVVPGFWRPIVGVDAFDLNEDLVDLTPWLPVLSDGKDHLYELKVVGLNDSASGNTSFSTVASNWVITGKLLLWLDKVGSVTKGDAPKVTYTGPTFSIQQNQTGTSAAGTVTGLVYTVNATRQIIINGSIITSEGTKYTSWNQSLEYSNWANLTNKGLNQTNQVMTKGREASGIGFSRIYSYPLNVTSDTEYNKETKDLYIGGDIVRRKTQMFFGIPIFPIGQDDFESQGEPIPHAWNFSTALKSSAWLRNVPAENHSESWGATEQVLGLYREFLPSQVGMGVDTQELLYNRHVLVQGGRIIQDQEVQLAELSPMSERNVRVSDAISLPIKHEILSLEDVKHAGGRRLQALLADSKIGNTVVKG